MNAFYYILVVPPITNPVTSHTTGKPCLIMDGMSDPSVIPNDNVINSRNVSVGAQIRLSGSSRGYTPVTNDFLIVILSQYNIDIFIGEILIEAENFVNATLSFKRKDDNEWTRFGLLTKVKTIFDNLLASQLQFKFNPNARYIKLGLIGCFSPSSKSKSIE